MNKTYSKAIVELVYSIRRQVEPNLKPSIKFSNPDLLTELVTCYRDSKNDDLRTLIKQLMEHAGFEWENKLKEKAQGLSKQQALMAYRLNRGSAL